jgi:hypothetical protein
MAKSRIHQVRNFDDRPKKVLYDHRKTKRISRGSSKVIIKFTKLELEIVHDLVLEKIDSEPKKYIDELQDIEYKTCS